MDATFDTFIKDGRCPVNSIIGLKEFAVINNTTKVPYERNVFFCCCWSPPLINIS